MPGHTSEKVLAFPPSRLHMFLAFCRLAPASNGRSNPTDCSSILHGFCRMRREQCVFHARHGHVVPTRHNMHHIQEFAPMYGLVSFVGTATSINTSVVRHGNCRLPVSVISEMVAPPQGKSGVIKLCAGGSQGPKCRSADCDCPACRRMQGHRQPPQA